MKAKFGRIHRVQNKDARFGSNGSYNYVRLKMGDGSSTDLLLTDNQIENATTRAEKNPEDCNLKITFKEWLKR